MWLYIGADVQHQHVFHFSMIIGCSQNNFKVHTTTYYV